MGTIRSDPPIRNDKFYDSLNSYDSMVSYDSTTGYTYIENRFLMNIVMDRPGDSIPIVRYFEEYKNMRVIPTSFDDLFLDGIYDEMSEDLLKYISARSNKISTTIRDKLLEKKQFKLLDIIYEGNKEKFREAKSTKYEEVNIGNIKIDIPKACLERNNIAIGDILHEGRFSSVYNVTNIENTVVRIANDTPTFKNEMVTQEKASKEGAGVPLVYRYDKAIYYCDDGTDLAFVLMLKIDYTLEEYLKKIKLEKYDMLSLIEALKRMFLSLENAKIYHIDYRLSNIGLFTRGKVVEKAVILKFPEIGSVYARVNPLLVDWFSPPVDKYGYQLDRMFFYMYLKRNILEDAAYDKNKKAISIIYKHMRNLVPKDYKITYNTNVTRNDGSKADRLIIRKDDNPTFTVYLPRTEH